MQAKTVRVEGRVQGVGFRYYILSKAKQHHIGGWVRNLPNGAVEIQAVGNEQNMNVFLDYCRIGPPLARVDKVAWSEMNLFEAKDFKILS
jgi:acylphosphatase